MAQIVYTDINGHTELQGALFQGTKYWFSQRVPSRSHFIEQVKANGGQVVALENQADVKIVDHARKEVAPGTHSYQYIERSLRNGALENLDAHRVGPPTGTIRTLGSATQPAKIRRNPFTAEDDRILYDWVASYGLARGTSGNEIYKQLEAQNPRHTFQSWRSRWIDHLKDRPRPPQVPDNAPPTPPLDQAAGIQTAGLHEAPSNIAEVQEQGFTDEDVAALLDVAEDILEIIPENVENAWKAWAANSPEHSPKAWQNFWEQSVRLVYLEKKAQEAVEEKPPDVATKTPGKYTVYEKDLITDEFALQRSPELLPLATPARDKQRPKRKRSTFEEELPHSSPLKSNAYTPNKRVRHERAFDSSIEIPSTPEKDCLYSNATFAMKEIDHVIDLESENEYHNTTDTTDIDPSLSPVVKLHLPTTHDKGDMQKSDPEDLLLGLLPPPVDWPEDEEGSQNEGHQQEHYQSEDYRQKLVHEFEPDQTQHKADDTQDIFQDKTPAMDFSVAEPDGGWEGLIPPSSPPELPASLQFGAGNEDSDCQLLDEAGSNEKLDAWIDMHLSSGVAFEVIATALTCTTMQSGLAELVIRSLVNGEGIPRRVKGVWTEEDDRQLYDEDARTIEALLRKHGQGEVDRRFEFRHNYDEGS